MAEHATREVIALRRLHALMARLHAEQDLQTLLDEVADGVVEVVGFQVAAISLLRPDDTLEVVAVAGDDGARRQLLGRRSALAEYLGEFAIAEPWGTLRFIPHDRLPENANDGWVSDLEPVEAPDAWHPWDTLYAPLHNPQGELTGIMSVDLPLDGLRPDQLGRNVLEMYAAQAAVAINRAAQREAEAHQSDLDHAVLEVVSAAARHLDLDQVLEASVRALRTGVRSQGVWVRAFESTPAGELNTHEASYPPHAEVLRSEQIHDISARAAHVCLDQQRAIAMSLDQPDAEPLTVAADRDVVLGFMRQIGARHLLMAPLAGAGACQGFIGLTRGEGDVPFDVADEEAVMTIGRELGAAVVHARMYAKQLSLVEELRALDAYKAEFIATLAHQLKNPLTSVLGHVEALEDAGAPQHTVAAILRNTDRVRRLVDDLLTLSKVEDANQPLVPGEVSLRSVLDEACDLLTVQAARRAVYLDCDYEAALAGGADGADGRPVAAGTEAGLTGGDVHAWGDRDELMKVVENIVGNAIKYTRDGGRVSVSLAVANDERDEPSWVVLEVRDTGLGISEDDQTRLFREFERSSNPEARALPGTGLGLAIVKRIVDRHGGTIEVESELGIGSLFRVSLPRSPAEVALERGHRDGTVLDAVPRLVQGGRRGARAPGDGTVDVAR